MEENLNDIFITKNNFKTNEEFSKFLNISALENGFILTKYQIKKQIEFLKYLISWNKKFNLTSIVIFEDMVYKHIIDSLLLLNCYEEKNLNFLDIGAGAGFPSIPIAILGIFEDIVQIESSKKKVDFLKFIKNKLNLKTNPINIRAEDAARKNEYREKFNLVSARAVAKLNILLELSLPFVELNGVFFALKGPDFETELNFSKKALAILGGEFKEIKKFSFKNTSIITTRNIIIFKKISHTTTKYPRNFSKILKNPI